MLERSASSFAAHVDRFELTEALEAAWGGVRGAEPLRRGARAVDSSRRTRRASAELDDDALHAQRRHARAGRAWSRRSCRDASDAMLAAVGAPGDAAIAGTGRAGPARGGRSGAAGGPLFPRVDEPLCVIDMPHARHQLRDDPAEVLARARAAGVSRVVTIGSSPRRWRRRRRWPTDDATSTRPPGLHPHHAADWSEAIAEEIRRRATHPRCVAIGETGLDWFRDRAPRDAQIGAFRGQLAIARELDAAGGDPLP